MATLTRTNLRLNVSRASPLRPVVGRRSVAPATAALPNFLMVLADAGIKVVEGGASRLAGEQGDPVPGGFSGGAAGAADAIDGAVRAAPGTVDAPLGPVILGSIVVGIVATAIIPLWLKPGQEAADKIFEAKGKPRQITESKIKRAQTKKK